MMATNRRRRDCREIGCEQVDVEEFRDGERQEAAEHDQRQDRKEQDRQRLQRMHDDLAGKAEADIPAEKHVSRCQQP